jgi:hypothetical protein
VDGGLFLLALGQPAKLAFFTLLLLAAFPIEFATVIVPVH